MFRTGFTHVAVVFVVFLFLFLSRNRCKSASDATTNVGFVALGWVGLLVKSCTGRALGAVSISVFGEVRPAGFTGSESN